MTFVWVLTKRRIYNFLVECLNFLNSFGEELEEVKQSEWDLRCEECWVWGTDTGLATTSLEALLCLLVTEPELVSNTKLRSRRSLPVANWSLEFELSCEVGEGEVWKVLTLVPGLRRLLEQEAAYCSCQDPTWNISPVTTITITRALTYLGYKLITDRCKFLELQYNEFLFVGMSLLTSFSFTFCSTVCSRLLAFISVFCSKAVSLATSASFR